MYETHWQLNEKPFQNVADPRFYYPSESHQAAILKLRYAVESRCGGALLAGPSGVGKTLVMTMVRDMLGEVFRPFIHLVFPQMPTAELLAYIADELDADSSTVMTSDIHASVRRIERFLAANAHKGRHAVIAIDEAHLLDGLDTLETLRLLLNFEPDGAPALTLLLVGQSAILPMLERMPQWEERLGVKCLLKALSEMETAAYVEHRLRVAGSRRTIIDHDAMPTLYGLTHGVARQINRLVDLALLIGFAEERQTLDAAHFQAVSNELLAISPQRHEVNI
jgi:type II secretory pathway predicted ATPase ExeA